MLLSRVKCLPSKTIDWSQLCKTGLSLKSSQLDGLVYFLNYFQRATTEIWSVGPFEITCLFSYAYLLFLKYTHNPHANRYSGTWRATPHVITTLNSVCPPSACLVKQGVCVCVCVCVRVRNCGKCCVRAARSKAGHPGTPPKLMIYLQNVFQSDD